MTVSEVKAEIQNKTLKTPSRICKEVNSNPPKRLKSNIWNVFHEIVHIESAITLEHTFFYS